MNHPFAKMAALGCLAAGMVFAQAAGQGRVAPNRVAPNRVAPNRAAQAAPNLGGVRQQILKNLNLTADQIPQVRKILQQAQTQAQPVQPRLQEARKALAAAVKNDPAQIPYLAAQVGQIQGQLLAIREQATAQIYALLTPEQKTRLERMEQRLRQREQRQPGRAGGN